MLWVKSLENLGFIVDVSELLILFGIVFFFYKLLSWVVFCVFFIGSMVMWFVMWLFFLGKVLRVGLYFG